jgi:hypothetical protein
MEFFLLELMDGENIAIPTEEINYVGEFIETYKIPFTGKRDSPGYVLLFRDRIFLVSPKYSSNTHGLYVLLKNQVALPIKGVYSKITKNDLEKEKGKVINYHNKKFHIFASDDFLIEMEGVNGEKKSFNR